MRTILAVGPRELPADGIVRVWVDTGSGCGREIAVTADRLVIADLDNGRGTSAVYAFIRRSGMSDE
ncbi:hypothetical protein GCM10010123_32980 [Pilimelia anulata]|uniref:Uncharacterized protein n=1 Tax=Pilimelia anulata TaxID=53371 RepID=A0A8J3B876_9ACTN|nr:hypothetical protein [Pilimelia anulata]GGK00476.1 hypothetical protein GCM10010123_32980 [Pilimelia anulata]